MRRALFWLLAKTPYGRRLFRRAVFCEVGFSGCGPTAFDKATIERERLTPLNRIERWLLRKDIDAARAIHRGAFRQSCIDVLGEDPDEWGAW